MVSSIISIIIQPYQDPYFIQVLLLLIRETKVHTEGRVDETLKGVGRGQRVGVLLNGSDILHIEVDEILAVGLDTGGGNGLGEDGGAAGNCGIGISFMEISMT